MSEELELAKARARARQRQMMLSGSLPESTEAPEPKALTFTNVVNEMNRGVMSLLPSFVRDPMESVGIGVQTPLTETTTGGALRFTGAGLPLAAGGAAVGTAGATVTKLPSTFSGIVGSMADDLARIATNNPRLYFGSEIAGSAGAGAASQIAQNQGAGPVGQLASEVAGGLSVAALPLLSQRLTGERLMQSTQTYCLLPSREEWFVRQGKCKRGPVDHSKPKSTRKGWRVYLMVLRLLSGLVISG